MSQLAQPAPGPPAASPTEPAKRGPVLGLGHLPTGADRDRRLGVERIIELSRWAVLIYATVTNNSPGERHIATAAVNLILGGWALFNLGATLTLLAKHLPGRRTQLAILAMDLVVASALVYLTGGFTSNLTIVFFVLIATSSLRFGGAGSLLCAAVISALYAGVGLAVAGGRSHAVVDTLVSRLLPFVVVSLASALLSREMVTARARQMAHTAELEHAVFTELREIDRIKSEFMMLASHELRTPLTKIKAWLSLMQDAGDHLPQKAQEEGFRELRTQTDHLGRLTDNLLCIAQLESGEIRLRPTAVDFSTVLSQVVSRFVEIADRGRFLVSIDDDIGQLHVDEERLALVLTCLIDNALKFAPVNEPVEINATRVVNAAHIEVRDNGRRIPDDQVGHVFASFYQVENPLLRKKGGFGVGLYLARQLVERMGGRIWLDNGHARGNSFFIAVPLEETSRCSATTNRSVPDR